MTVYSPFFQTLYDQPAPVGELGRGAHYSVLRCITHKDNDGDSMYPAGNHDFAVIWDEDHDTRVIPVIETLYRKDMLHGALFVGERKGGLCVVVSDEFRASLTKNQFEIYQDAVEQVAQDSEDPWTSHVEALRDLGMTLIQDTPERTRLYLDGIQLLWRLGCKKANGRR